jgi:hypothetical protein
MSRWVFPWECPVRSIDTKNDFGFQRFRVINHLLTVQANAAWAYDSEINWVIMDYLVAEGYPGAAEKFAQETSLCKPADVESITARVDVRKAIHAGQIDQAISLINEIDAQVSTRCSPLPVEMITPSFHAPLIYARFGRC